LNAVGAFEDPPAKGAISLTRVGQLVKDLEAIGYVERSERKQRTLRPTVEGREFLRRLRAGESPPI